MYEKYDSFIGTVTHVTPSGCCVGSENEPGIKGFYHGSGRIGDKVMCSVIRVNGPKSLSLSLDSVISFAPLYLQCADAA